MLTYSYLQGVEPPPRRPRDRCGETPSPLEKANAQLKRKRRRITNSAGVPAGTCICCTQDTTNFALIFRVRDVTGVSRRATERTSGLAPPGDLTGEHPPDEGRRALVNPPGRRRTAGPDRQHGQ